MPLHTAQTLFVVKSYYDIITVIVFCVTMDVMDYTCRTTDDSILEGVPCKTKPAVMTNTHKNCAIDCSKVISVHCGLGKVSWV